MPDPASTSHRPALFKGIALFTPAGDLVYGIDPFKQTRWHMQLCAALQDILGLPELPHFLVPCYTATIDRWVNPTTQHVQTSAEACRPVLRHQALLNAVFDVGNVVWEAAPENEEICDPLLLSTYRQRFPQLWEEHELIVRFETIEPHSREESHRRLSWPSHPQRRETQGYVLRLYVSGNNGLTERTLQNLHQLLERSLQQPYTLKVVDIYKNPELAEADQVAATPTLVKAYPLPVRRFVGDLDNKNRLLQFLASPGT